MRTLAQLQAAYADPAADRLQVIRELEFVEDEGKWDWLTTILVHSASDYLEKIEVLRIVEVAAIPGRYGDLVAGAIRDIIQRSDDEEVRNYAVMAMKNFAGNGAMLALAKKILLDSKEDIDVRWNAFGVFKAKKSGPEVDDVVTALGENKEFGRAVKGLVDNA